MKILFHLAMFILFAGCCAHAAGESTRVESSVTLSAITLELVMPAYADVGEPVAATVTLKNNSAIPVGRLGPKVYSQIQVLGPDGKRIASSAPNVSHDATGPSVDPGKSEKLDFDLSKWFELKERGIYRVDMVFDGVFINKELRHYSLSCYFEIGLKCKDLGVD